MVYVMGSPANWLYSFNCTTYHTTDSTMAVLSPRSRISIADQALEEAKEAHNILPTSYRWSSTCCMCTQQPDV